MSSGRETFDSNMDDQRVLPESATVDAFFDQIFEIDQLRESNRNQIHPNARASPTPSLHSATMVDAWQDSDTGQAVIANEGSDHDANHTLPTAESERPVWGSSNQVGSSWITSDENDRQTAQEIVEDFRRRREQREREEFEIEQRDNEEFENDIRNIIDDVIRARNGERSSVNSWSSVNSPRPLRWQPPIPIATEFLNHLEILDVELLPEDQGICSICQEPYLTADGTQREKALLLPNCRHVFGHYCLETWLNPDLDDPHNTCPMCRDELFDPRGATGAFSDLLDNEDPLDFDLRPNENSWPEPRSELDWTTQDFLNAISEASDRAADDDFLIVQRRANPVSDDLPLSPLSPRSFSGRILHCFRLFDHHLNGDIVDDNGITIIDHERERDLGSGAIASALGAQMGYCYSRLEHEMEERNLTVPWGEEGPVRSFLMDPAAVPLVEIAMERLVEIEKHWNEMRMAEDEERVADRRRVEAEESWRMEVEERWRESPGRW